MAETALFGKPSAPAEETAVVVEAFGDTVRVRPQVSAACDSCGAHSLCFPASGSQPLIEARNVAGARTGDVVILQRAEAPRIGAALILFGVPVVCLAGGAALGSAGGGGQGSSVAGAIAGLALGLLLLRLLNQLLKRKAGFRPVVEKIVGQSPPEMFIPGPHTG